MTKFLQLTIKNSFIPGSGWNSLVRMALVNADNILAVEKRETRSVQDATMIRMADGVVYEAKEQYEEIRKQLTNEE